jgi:hypothetical protein
MGNAKLLEWAEKQPEWAQDALRRHAIRPGHSLTDEDNVSIANSVRKAAGFVLDDVSHPEPISSEHLKSGNSSEKRAVLCSFGPVKNLNRLAEEQMLRFATDGLTIIYGDNGSGKSGYCRVAKKLCRSLTTDELLGNVFEAGIKPPAEVMVRFLEDGETEPTEVSWKDDGTGPPAPIARISVFDSANARLYVDKQNRIGFLPTAIALLERHGSHRRELEAIFKEEIKAIDRALKTPLPGGYSANGLVSKMFSRLDVKSKEPLPKRAAIEELSQLSVDELEQLSALELALASDPSTMAARRRRAMTALSALKAESQKVDVVLADAAVAEFGLTVSRAQTTAKAAELAALGAFASMPLDDVGMSPWRLMFDYAVSYWSTISDGDHKHLPDQVGERCVLCLEPLTPDAAHRMSQFNEFVTGAANAAAQVADEELQTALSDIRQLNISSKSTLDAALGEFGDLSAERKAMVPTLFDYFDAATRRRSRLVENPTETDFADLPALAKPVAAILADEVSKLAVEAAADEEAAGNDLGRAAQRLQRDALTDRQKLSLDLELVLSRLTYLDERAKLTACCDTVETGSVSRIMTVLRRSLVMENLETRILAEIEGLALTHIPFAVSDRSEDGQSYFEVGLNAPKAIGNNRVLSEGEQRALALACFLAEVGGDATRQGIIIDDPVSSLDHVRIRKVAGRLVKEAAAGRQVIIFTHNLLFFNEVVDAAAQTNPPVPIARNYISKSEAAGFGVISETDEPWLNQAVTKRIENLRKRHQGFEAVQDFATEEWRRTAKDFYTDLRETWERLVEEVLLGKVVERFSSDVRTQSLRGVIIDDDDHKQVFWAMKRVSERSGHDMAAGKAIPTPTPLDMKADLDQIDTYRDDAVKRKKDVEKRRLDLERPPKGTLA